MIFNRQWILALLAGFGVCIASSAQSDNLALVQRHWFETRTAHFNIYSCGSPQEVYQLAARLEQFCETYTQLAGVAAVASPPIVVLAFPDYESMKPFLPLYQGQPSNVSGFFQRGSDENLIVLVLPGKHAAYRGMQVIFHEYAHLLFRHNDRLWPLWLKEGMADVYSTFEAAGYRARIGDPIPAYLELLQREPLLPLADLFAVTPDSSRYNERERQGIFYAESWLLAQFLMAGDVPGYTARFGHFTGLLREGQLPEPAFTNALETTLPAMEFQLRRYLQRGRFIPIQLVLSTNVSTYKTLVSRAMTPVENYFRLGDELLRIDRLDTADTYFTQAQKLAPASPLPYEGLGLLAAERDQHEDALRDLKEAVRHGQVGFLACYIYARERYRLTADSDTRYTPVKSDVAAEIRDKLQESIALMPNFAPAHHLIGFLEMVQGENLTNAEHELQLASRLEPENPSYLLSLAQAQIQNKDSAAARRTLEPLLLPNAEAKLRVHAEELLREISREAPAQ